MNAVASAEPRARRWPLLLALLAFAAAVLGAVWIRGERLRALATLHSRLPLRVERSEGLLWPNRLHGVVIEVSPELSVAIGTLELGGLPWHRSHKAHEVVVRAHAPLDTLWAEARGLAATVDLDVTDARLEYTDTSGRKLRADGVTFALGQRRDHLHAQSLHVLGATFRDVHVWASRPSTVLELRLARQEEEPKAPTLTVSSRSGEAVEWALDIPSQPFPQWANRLGLGFDETWSSAVFVGVGSLIVPESSARPARGDLRFTIDNWHRPSWPDAALLMGRSGAVALRMSPGPEATHAITRVEVAAGLFSLVGTGQLSLGQPNRLTFDAQGELACERLHAHLPASVYRDLVQAHLDQRPQGAANRTSVRLALAVRAEAPSLLPLSFRWHLHAGCGLPEMNEHAPTP
jgi:hypothetical protein